MRIPIATTINRTEMSRDLSPCQSQGGPRDKIYRRIFLLLTNTEGKTKITKIKAQPSL